MADSTRHFVPTDRTPTTEKRTECFTLRLTLTEREILDRAAAEKGITAQNLLRKYISDGLDRSRKPKR